jgi:hypothetical protein
LLSLQRFARILQGMSMHIARIQYMNLDRYGFS